ncbi:MAG: FKBP-type peptidyl-prolyl cis-trans isomerase [Pseudanabaenaceae cyanobacterium]
MKGILISFGISLAALVLIFVVQFVGSKSVAANSTNTSAPTTTAAVQTVQIVAEADPSMTTDYTTDPSFTQTPSGLRYKDLKVGDGAVPLQGQGVVVHYTGTLLNGKKFDSSVDRRSPFTFKLGAGQVIRGWDEGLSTMKVGGKRILVLPPDLAYGNRDVGNGLIPANSTLVFEVELLRINP